MYENDVIFDKQAIPADIQSVIDLYKSFSKYGNNTEEELYYHVLPSFELKQCKYFKENNKVIAFANWAYFDDKAEREYKKTYEVSTWNNGSNAWVIDVVCRAKASKMMLWLRQNFKKVKWVKLNKPSRRIGTRGY